MKVKLAILLIIALFAKCNTKAGNLNAPMRLRYLAGGGRAEVIKSFNWMFDGADKNFGLFKNYDKIAFLGAGAYGEVSLWKNKLRGNKVAVKRMPYTKGFLRANILGDKSDLYDISHLTSISDEIKASKYIQKGLLGSNEYNFFGHLKSYIHDDSYYYLIYDYYPFELPSYLESYSISKSKREILQE